MSLYLNAGRPALVRVVRGPWSGGLVVRWSGGPWSGGPVVRWSVVRWSVVRGPWSMVRGPWSVVPVREATLVFARPGARNAAWFRRPPRACDMPHRLSVDESNSGGRATSRSRAPLLTQVLVQGSFLLLTYQCTSDLYYPLLFSCTSECSSEHSCLFCCTSEFECTSAQILPTFVLHSIA